MKSLFIYGGFLFLCVSFFSCSDNDKNNSNNFATGIVELPALRNGANDVFVTHYTTFNGQKVTSFSMEYDKSKKHSRWIGSSSNLVVISFLFRRFPSSSFLIL